MRKNTIRRVHAMFLFAFALCAATALRGTGTARAIAPGVTSDAVTVSSATRRVFTFTLAKAAARTSAGVYDSAGHLVRVLWTMQRMDAGVRTDRWDGKKDDGSRAPPGRYSYRVVVNRSIYREAGVIGNTGSPPTTSGHVPINFESVAVDSRGNAYTVHDWDEAHFDVIEWAARDGHSLGNSGHLIGGLCKAVAVDEAHVYVTSYDNLDNRREAKFSITRLRRNSDAFPPAPGGATMSLDPFIHAGGAILVYDGGNSAAYPVGVTDVDKAAMRIPLLSLAVFGHDLYATDALGGRVLVYDKVTGDLRREIRVPLPQCVAVGPDGRVWVGHEHSRVSVFAANGTLLATPLTDVEDVNAVVVRHGRLYVADQGSARVRIFTIVGNRVTAETGFGARERPGDPSAACFNRIHGLAVDADGNVLVAADGNFFSDGRLTKFSPAYKPIWRQMGLEFASHGTYNADDPDTFFTAMHHAYHLDRKTGTATFLGTTHQDTSYRSDVGPIRAVRLGGHDFIYRGNGDGVAVFRVVPSAGGDRGPTLRPAAIVSGNSPTPGGRNTIERWLPVNYYLWSWHDERGDGKIREAAADIFQRPEDKGGFWQYGPLTPDAEGNLFFASYAWIGGHRANEIWEIPLLGLDHGGNPIYRWRNARRVTTRDQVGFDGWEALPKMVQVGDDGSLYAYGYTPDKRAPQDGGLHMGGNVLMRFQMRKGAAQAASTEALPVAATSPQPETPPLAFPQWQILLPRMCVGLDAIPGGPGGVMIGGDPWHGAVDHYSRDGLLIGQFRPEARFGTAPDNPSGLLDEYGAVTVNRDPRDGVLDVFVEDDYNDRIHWYRVDDRDIQTLTGPIATTN